MTNREIIQAIADLAYLETTLHDADSNEYKLADRMYEKFRAALNCTVQTKTLRTSVRSEVDAKTKEDIINDLHTSIVACCNISKATKVWLWEHLTGNTWEDK